MTYCDAMNTYANKADWISHGFLLLLGVWKMWELGAALRKWFKGKLNG